MMINPGDRIGYARPFLQAVSGGDPTCYLWHRRGTVVDIQGRFAVVQWDQEPGNSLVAISNIATVGSFAFAHKEARGWIGYGALGEKPRSPWKNML